MGFWMSRMQVAPNVPEGKKKAAQWRPDFSDTTSESVKSLYSDFRTLQEENMLSFISRVVK
jgi:hypothetical protein